MARPYTRRVLQSGDKIFWTDEECREIAVKWIELRLTHPFNETPTELLEKAQRQAIPANRQRTVPGFLTAKGVVKAVEQLWKLRLARMQVDAAPAETEVQIVPLEVPRKLTYQEMLAELDEPSLEALLCAKRIARETRRDELLYGNAVANGATHLPKVPAFIPKAEVFESPRTHGPRIAIVGQSAAHKDILEAEVKTASLDVTLRFPDPADATAMGRCDYAIVCRARLHGATNSDGDKVIGTLGRNQVILLDEPTTVNIMQRIRDICSRK